MQSFPYIFPGFARARALWLHQYAPVDSKAMQLAAKLKLRARLAEARMFCERQTLASVGVRRVKPAGRLLCYHSVGQPELGVNDCSPERFRRHLQVAEGLGFRFVPAAQIANGLGGPRDIAITFDDGWKSVFTIAAPLLAEREIPLTLFVATGLIEGQSDWHRPRMVTWDQLGELSKMGVEIGSHSVTHPDFGVIDRQMAVEELTSSRITLKSRLGLEVDSFAIPFGQSKNWTPIAQDAATQAGYNLIYSQAENTRPLGTVPRTFVTWMDSDRIFNALLEGVFDDWEEWY